MDIPPQNKWVCSDPADAAIKAGDYESGIRLHQRILKEEPANGLSMYHLGYAYGRIGDHTQEIYYYEKAISHGYDRDGNLYYNLGMAYGELDMTQKAIAAFKKGMEIDPESADMHFGLGLAYQANTDFSLAEDEFKKAIDRMPEHIDARLNLSILYADMGELRKARIQLEKILAIDSNNEMAREFLKKIEKE